MKIVRETKTKYGSFTLQQEDWSSDFPTIHHGADQLAVYPIAAETVPRRSAFLAVRNGRPYWTHAYPVRGEVFRLGMYFPTESAASDAYEKLERGEACIIDYAEFFDITPNLTVEDILTALGAKEAKP